ncbi:uncharacterized protein K444DRAFT_611147 [Hyaloscypha bicolor E]|uniref:Transmembrane protein n=1 Tax=Hyaloscypha bicolor E TaxID=1095630 RepID=A0A2J6TFY9_9HELO|nr:uncharacterized protein K444DRAFT_611147 [Hyaloscypha bicolor E]PMD61931.1 hypothetical protein K444DRAFT_611147 [Hyaloscypha bicolor E]
MSRVCWRKEESVDIWRLDIFLVRFGGRLGVCGLEVVVLLLRICGDFRNWIHLFVNQNLY